MKKVLSICLVICLLSAMMLTTTTPANATSDYYVDMLSPYYDQNIEVTEDDLTIIIEVWIVYEGHYIFQTYGSNAVYSMKLYGYNSQFIKADYFEHGFEDNYLIGVYLTPGRHYLHITYSNACDSRFSITYTSDWFYGHRDSNDRLYLQNYEDIEPDSILNMGATFYYDNQDEAFISLVDVYEEGTYKLYVTGDTSAVAYLIDPSSVDLHDSTMSTFYSAGTIDMTPGIPYYLVVHINGLYGNDPANLAESITVWAYLEKIA